MQYIAGWIIHTRRDETSNFFWDIEWNGWMNFVETIWRVICYLCSPESFGWCHHCVRQLREFGVNPDNRSISLRQPSDDFFFLLIQLHWEIHFVHLNADGTGWCLVKRWRLWYDLKEYNENNVILVPFGLKVIYILEARGHLRHHPWKFAPVRWVNRYYILHYHR